MSPRANGAASAVASATASDRVKVTRGQRGRREQGSLRWYQIRGRPPPHQRSLVVAVPEGRHRRSRRRRPRCNSRSSVRRRRLHHPLLTARRRENRCCRRPRQQILPRPRQRTSKATAHTRRRPQRSHLASPHVRGHVSECPVRRLLTHAHERSMASGSPSQRQAQAERTAKEFGMGAVGGAPRRV